MKNKLVIGLVGEKGSGKETFGNFLMEIAKDEMIVRIHFSDILKETLELWNIPQTRKNLQDLAVLFVKFFNKDALSYATFERAKKLNADLVILDGVRWKSDVTLVRQFPNNLLIYITADVKKRFDRLKKRNSKVGEGSMSFKQFLKEEKAKNELLIPKIGARADIKLENNGSLDKFKKKIKEVYSTLQL
ncbi:MAG: hypothetical protein US28_C0024G0022 [Candidatus Daviesbacteria bacterium GW2011_GWA1_36_8]|uniref:Dephospho-CoA kinase-like protein n=2 Tax=Candidatus Daviesiibacteriota TaxID=1752718 RepID=A0A0G0EXE1_9BACT|nr:MAG: hypothetical protein US19_C0008G0030 [Candidatus Daviesbacteria bacterium GW2011_GWB1_36_5]KKQ15065.1 MAG: hypothetical protein US28_C0024G0022 [Candidatus Daviesbacteria bacterium GW2011_GWA1_36_8]